MKIAYITYNGTASYSAANNFNELEGLLPYLQNKGLDITAEIWDDPQVNWKQYEVALLKTPWDYFEKYEQFKDWLNKIERLQIKLINDYAIVRWNMDKHYLKEVAAAGFEIIPSVFLNQGWKDKLQALFDQLHADKLIIKPCVSGGSRNTIVLARHNAHEDTSRVHELLTEGDYIVQPLMPQVQEGEWSFIFFNGQYSHTIIKKPKAGDFRVQQIFGGTIASISPRQQYIDQAKSYITRFAQNTMYARVDGLMVNGNFVLMELELIDPFLYLSYGTGAIERYYNALLEQLAGK